MCICIVNYQYKSGPQITHNIYSQYQRQNSSTHSNSNMANTTLEAYLHQQSQLYQTLLHNVTVLKRTIQHQENMKHNQTIPKQYLPRPLTTFGTTSQGETFKTQYKDLLFQHLDKVLIHNQTNLELQQTKLTNIITDTERQLSTSTESTDQITLYYHQFMTNNKITNHQTLPSLKARLTNSATHTTNQKTNS